MTDREQHPAGTVAELILGKVRLLAGEAMGRDALVARGRRESEHAVEQMEGWRDEVAQLWQAGHQ